MLIFHGGSHPSSSPEEMQAQMGKWMSWIEKLRKEDRYVTGEPLVPGGKLLSGADKAVTDGPFTEGKEVVGGFFIVRSGNLDEAVEMAKDYPDFNQGGTVQVRQVMKM